MKDEDLTFSDIFYYDETSKSGLRWKIDRYSGRNYTRKVATKDTEPISIDGHGYYAISFKGKVLRAHLVILALCNINIPKGYCVDHIDRNRLNNNLSNLRVVKKVINERNMKLRSTNTSGTTGVYLYTDSSKEIPKQFFVAQCANLNGSRTVKRFSIKKFGYDLAYEKAVECREQMLKRLNSEGACYSELHGK